MATPPPRSTTGLTDLRARRPGLPGDDAPPPAMRPAQPALLESIVVGALDPAYADAAARRGQAPPRGRSAAVVLLLVGGLVVGLAVGRERTGAPAAEQARTALLGDARQRTATVTELSNRIGELRRETTQLQASVLDDSRQGRAVAQQRESLATGASETAVTGPGVEVSIDDATRGGRPSDEQRPDGTVVAGRVRDRDLQDVVNALWAAGAEAISVGGVRLSPTTAIRTAGETILADYRPLTAPYVFLVVGDSATLGAAFRSVGSDVLTRLRSEGSPVRVTPRTELQLPAATGTDTRFARPLTSGIVGGTGAGP
jgi:uncharacterized protein YlxW (UPF0749 family)